MRDKSDNSVNIVCLHLSQRLAAALYALKRDELTKSDTSVIGSLSAPAGATCCVSYCLIPAPVCAYLLFIKSNTCIFQLLWMQLSRMHACMLRWAVGYGADHIVASPVAEAQRRLMTQAPLWTRCSVHITWVHI